MRRFRQWISPVPAPLGGDGRWHSGHLWSGRQLATPRYTAGVNARAHTGLDIAGVSGSLLVAPDDGIIESWGWSDLGGWVVVVKHEVRVGNYTATVWSRHSHCLRDQLVIPGHTVEQGQPIAKLGSTGASASPHDHTSITLTAVMPSWQLRHMFLDPEPIYYQGRAAFMQQGHPYPNEVRKLQRRLNAVGCTPALTDDGEYGPATAKAVKWYQAKVGTEAHGAASELTLALLFSARPGKEA